MNHLSSQEVGVKSLIGTPKLFFIISGHYDVFLSSLVTVDSLNVLCKCIPSITLIRHRLSFSLSVWLGRDLFICSNTCCVTLPIPFIEEVT